MLSMFVCCFFGHKTGKNGHIRKFPILKWDHVKNSNPTISGFAILQYKLYQTYCRRYEDISNIQILKAPLSLVGNE